MLTTEFLDYWADLAWREYVKHVGLYAVMASVLAVLGPFGTDQDPFLWRFSYWLVNLGFFGGLIMPLTARLSRPIRVLARAPILPGVLTLFCMGNIPMTMFVILTDWLLYKWIMVASWLPFAEVTQVRRDIRAPGPANLPDALALYGNVLAVVLISIGMISIFVINRHIRQAQSLGLKTRPGVSFFSRLPDHIGTDLIYLQMEDHYLRAVTKVGNTLILMRFRDALNEVAGVSGIQVHRSWWVASSHVVKLTRSGRNLELIMSDHARIPVSSSYKDAVEQIFLAT
ncbi:MAG: LytTR family DNA-binding domain-containing protein [Sphingorhabdus sp.]